MATIMGCSIHHGMISVSPTETTKERFNDGRAIVCPWVPLLSCPYSLTINCVAYIVGDSPDIKLPNFAFRTTSFERTEAHGSHIMDFDPSKKLAT